MAQKTSIEWTEQTWNFLRGCRRVSEGCKNCYAEQIAGRFSGTDKNGKELPYFGLATKNGEARWTGKVSFHEDILLEPLKRKKPTTYFVNSMSDLFYEEVKNEWIDKAFAVMALTPQHTYQILTKRPARMHDYLNYLAMDKWNHYNERIRSQVGYFLDKQTKTTKDFLDKSREYENNETLPLPNVHLGVSVENQKTANERIPLLLDVPAKVRFLSCEPLLENLDLTKWIHEPRQFRCTGDYCSFNRSKPDCEICYGTGWQWTKKKLHWVIVGGESGTNARPCDVAWIRRIVEQCKKAGTKVFVKQLGSKPFNSAYLPTPHVLPVKNKKGGDIEEFPIDLQIRQFPKGAHK